MTANEKTTPDEKTKQDESFKIEEAKLGVWTFRIAHSSKRFVFDKQKIPTYFQESYTFFSALFVDAYRIAPYHFIVYLVCQLADGLEDLALLALSNELLRKIESGIVTGSPDLHGIIVALVARLVFACAVLWIKWYSERVEAVLERKVVSHFKAILMKSNLQLDLAASQEAGSRPEASANEAWTSLRHLINLITGLVRSGSQVAFITNMSGATGGPLFVALSLSQPMFSTFFTSTIWDKVCYGFVHNPAYERIMALEKFADGNLRQDIISGGLAWWITTEHQRANKKLGDVSTNDAWTELENRQIPLQAMLTELFEFSPVIYCAINTAFNPRNFSVSSVAMLQQSSTHLRYSLHLTLIRLTRIQRDLLKLKTIYKTETTHTSDMEKGVIPYPPATESKDCDESPKGMAFELKDVTFSYPGSKKVTPGLKGVSLKINAGDVVVIVGANGSGKSTLIRLLSRLYDPSSGSVCIDGRPAKEYIVSDLHKATALLSQDNSIYPLSLGENIGLGFPEMVQNTKLVQEAAEDGGAAEFISKLKDGMGTVLKPAVGTFQINMYNNKSHVLYKEMEETARKNIDISGGERQKVVAARSFMRFKSGNIKFVAVDEPSSALDAEAELKLFQNLIKVREGKTLVFVTHRFGHLTQYADQIICMKDGAVCEYGSHEELMAKKGDYAKLYEIQAAAFPR